MLEPDMLRNCPCTDLPWLGSFGGGGQKVNFIFSIAFSSCACNPPSQIFISKIFSSVYLLTTKRKYHCKLLLSSMQLVYVMFTNFLIYKTIVAILFRRLHYLMWCSGMYSPSLNGCFLMENLSFLKKKTSLS